MHKHTTVSAQNAVIDHVTCCQKGNLLRQVHYSPQKGLKQKKGDTNKTTQMGVTFHQSVSEIKSTSDVPGTESCVRDSCLITSDVCKLVVRFCDCC